VYLDKKHSYPLHKNNFWPPFFPPSSYSLPKYGPKGAYLVTQCYTKVNSAFPHQAPGSWPGQLGLQLKPNGEKLNEPITTGNNKEEAHIYQY